MSEPTPVEPTPVEPTPVEPTPVEPTPVEPAPVEPAPVEPAPVEPAPVEPTPVEPTPVEPTPVDDAPVADAAVHDAAAVIRTAVADLGLEVTESRPGLFSVALPGTAKLSTECALEVGRHGVGVRAFVARNPDEHHAGVYRWLLERNLKLYGVAFSVDRLGDVYLTGKIALASVTAAEIDRVLGAVAEASDSSFNTILELGFAESIRREWAWRRSRGESTANLAAFAQLDPGEAGPPHGDSGEPPAGGRS